MHSRRCALALASHTRYLRARVRRSLPRDARDRHTLSLYEPSLGEFRAERRKNAHPLSSMLAARLSCYPQEEITHAPT